MTKALKQFNQMFPLWALLFATLAYFQPQIFLGLGDLPLITLQDLLFYLLALIMFFMGLTLTPADFVRVFTQPHKVLLGTSIQFLLMPLVAWILAKALLLSPELTAGMVLVGATAGGTASNVMTYLAGGRVALSITMTLVSTLVAIVATPLLTRLYVGQALEVPVIDMMKDIAMIVVLPVVFGVICNRVFNSLLRKSDTLFATGSMLCILLVIALVVSLNAGRIAALAPVLALAVMLHNLAGLAAGYYGAKFLKCDERECRTIAIEVGMQNSGLAAALAAKYFGAAAALPGALFSVWHNISGALLAGHWSRIKVKDDR
ncbi:bile acid:sodium symporter family protein [Marinospirillum alkaliphilum]|uniref:Bile acid:Na+ symporter, BASS family n=1 Tax=Marinospirillum alkaliphilum DSM 21637 TaxID=1122209 RepID=A0A1K1Z7S6_9GAMM|nr:bile acid:sodium symporter family protein [Marinospirillum alkaliphilum]SFX70166.1 bile acid:Na+ symporter, BASS family [Marinospirillum alkaliphilum DSM 21637]